MEELPFIQKINYIQHHENIYYPKNTAEVMQLINFARNNNRLLRCLGSEHSPHETIFDDNSRTLLVVLSGELRTINNIQLIDNGEFALITVGAGCNLGLNPQDKASTWENSFNQQIDQLGFALPSLGGISHQTIAGFLQTSSSGGSSRYSVAEAIEAIEFINGKGELIQLKKDDPDFAAVGVSMGLMGVVTQVTFKCAKRYLVQGIEENKCYEDSYLKKDEKGDYSALKNALYRDHDYIHLNWFPQKYINRVMHWQGNRTTVTQPIKTYKHPLKSKMISMFAALALKLGNLIDYKTPHCDLAQRFKALLIKNFVNLKDKKDFCDTWYKILPIDDQADVDGLINTAFSELWFPKESINLVMDRLNQLFAQEPQAVGNFIVEFYAAKNSPFWLSPSYGRDSFRVDLYWWLKNKGDAHQYFSRIWSALIDIPGIRFHWGKQLPKAEQHFRDLCFNQQFLSKSYPQFEAWLKKRDEMDPEQIFVNNFYRQLFAIPRKKLNFSPQLFSLGKEEDTQIIAEENMIRQRL